MTARQHDDTGRIRDALQFIDASDRDTWVRMGMAVKSELGDSGFDLWEDWSQQADTFNAKDARDVWRSIAGDGKITAGTLFHEAKANGWRDDGKHPGPTGSELAERLLINAERRKQEEARKASKRADAARKAAAMWEAASPAPDDHAYLVRKGVKAHGAKLHNGVLLIPVRANGVIHSLQFIDSDGQKRFLTDGRKAGCYFSIGDTSRAEALCIAEGFATAATINEATGYPVVVAFDAGNLMPVAKEMREKFPALPLILCADDDRHTTGNPGLKKATEAARAVGGLLAVPDFGTDRQDGATDFNDMAAQCGLGAVKLAIASASHASGDIHPLARFVELALVPRPPRWVLPGFVAEGVVVFAGSRGVGKSTAMLPLAMAAAGMHEDGYQLAPEHWRHVIYITEDILQAERVIVGFAGALGIAPATISERLHFVEAQRLPPDSIVEVGPLYRSLYARRVGDVEVPPLVVFDTIPAVISLENENDNGEASAAVAALKQRFSGLPCWLIGHVSKANMTRSDAENLTLRGAGALEGDVHHTLAIFKDGDRRWIAQGKHRFEARWLELELHSDTCEVDAENEFGTVEPLTLRWSIARPAETSRQQLAQEAREDAKKGEAASLRLLIMQAVEQAWEAGNPLSRTGVRSTVGGKARTVGDAIDEMVDECFLQEVFVPSKERTHPKRAAFLVALTKEERQALIQDGVLPAEKNIIPPSWKRPEPEKPASGNEWERMPKKEALSE